jgi:DNA-binding IclR family transcriptional regulator
VPLRKSDGRTIASLNIGVHSARTSIEAMNGAYLAKLRELADRLQEQLI